MESSVTRGPVWECLPGGAGHHEAPHVQAHREEDHAGSEHQAGGGHRQGDYSQLTRLFIIYHSQDEEYFIWIECTYTYQAL